MSFLYKSMLLLSVVASSAISIIGSDEVSSGDSDIIENLVLNVSNAVAAATPQSVRNLFNRPASDPAPLNRNQKRAAEKQEKKAQAKAARSANAPRDAGGQNIEQPSSPFATIWHTAGNLIERVEDGIGSGRPATPVERPSEEHSDEPLSEPPFESFDPNKASLTSEKLLCGAHSPLDKDVRGDVAVAQEPNSAETSGSRVDTTEIFAASTQADAEDISAAAMCTRDEVAGRLQSDITRAEDQISPSQAGSVVDDAESHEGVSGHVNGLLGVAEQEGHGDAQPTSSPVAKVHTTTDGHLNADEYAAAMCTGDEVSGRLQYYITRAEDQMSASQQSSAEDGTEFLEGVSTLLDGLLGVAEQEGHGDAQPTLSPVAQMHPPTAQTTPLAVQVNTATAPIKKSEKGASWSRQLILGAGVLASCYCSYILYSRYGSSEFEMPMVWPVG